MRVQSFVLRSTRFSTAVTRSSNIQTHSSRKPSRTALRRTMSTTASRTPMADTIRAKLTETFSPTSLSLHNDSHQHSHHAAMRTNPAHQAGRDTDTEPETHFRVYLVSAAFEGKMPPARHRMVYATLKEELAREGGVHALQISARTPAEEEKRVAREQQGGNTA